jgi:hypothetical protein
MPTIDRDGVSIHYEVHGHCPALPLSYGYGATMPLSRMRERVASAASRVRVIAA